MNTANRPSLCHVCRNVKIIDNCRGSTFYQCRANEQPVYPPQPVMTCPQYAAKANP